MSVNDNDGRSCPGCFGPHVAEHAPAEVGKHEVAERSAILGAVQVLGMSEAEALRQFCRRHLVIAEEMRRRLKEAERPKLEIVKS